ncbi:thiamine-monophosphate kinase [Betaproteobacteria bacterium]|nr:thiamine-monophosphate kinase [Betaproteobacteria bacterium]GHU45040.1 thiamine-monophosphate kinase [Betaproteobacteria bacterium]
MTEFDLISRHFQRPATTALLGVGDDCALTKVSPGMELALTTDMLVAGTHFFPDADPHDLGWKTLAVNLSDLAAMGANPRWALLALSLPAADENWLASFAEGFFACAQKFGVDLIGGDTTRGALTLCVTAAGEIPAGAALRRDGAREGDDLWLSGQAGFAALGLQHLQGDIELPEPLCRLCLKRLHAPQPRVALGLALRDHAHAAIDISDGVIADVGHIAERSGLTAEILLHQLPRLPEAVPRAIALAALLTGGDDYELAFTALPDKRLELARIAAELDVPLWRIGRMAATSDAPSVQMLDPEGKIVPCDFLHTPGYDHFRESST